MNWSKWSRLAGLAWLVSSAVASARPAGSAAPVIGDAIDVRVVNVEVVVTDWRGHRVTDLKPGDFRLKVDGKAVPVEYFTEVRDGRAAGTAGDAGSPVPGMGAGEAIGTPIGIPNTWSSSTTSSRSGPSATSCSPR